MKLTLVQYFIVIVLSFVDKSAGGSCKAAKLCCQGRDSGCVIQKVSPNAIIESPKDKPCYCDHACLKLNDCCDDFRETCSVVDCTVSEWGTWSACDNLCGVGIQSRIRVITQSKQNGGKHCPQLEQSRICQEHIGCRHREKDLYANNVTLLMTWSEVNFKLNETTIAVHGVCSTFTVIWASRACGKDFPGITLGTQICVICKNNTGNGNCRNENPLGSTGIGRWKIMTSTSTRCHGKWIDSTDIRQQCDPSNCKNKMFFVYI
ncbi:somatomedin-B and thrombospondin type-1 domain-containing protein-like [Chelonus insularis]|uniref:somatomedin-B and thrombospondin type-1 domain-containing protein-like n=1 Tax=Chelonus insularis TaxID=460826 RepID=UPI00158A2254|nr:somatomedin-B and thrombospondin type-1 domain-containing protein-like [Chelonus insularis]XP_034943898.1 somatomedin-B and thrombospondin type-1 domain-containing protein-like [Chelonus insularis]